jgi:PTH1 family peptidyl-tRNA hydrolase
LPQKRMRLIVGLGNPGIQYEHTRHNAGFMVVDRLAKDFNISSDKKKFETLYGRGTIEGHGVILAKPMAFMNRSGPPVQKLAYFFKIPSKDTLVIHDDIDLAFGRLKIKEKGGHGGHKGLKSIIDAFGEGEFIRLRIGVGRSEVENDVTDHVLGRFTEGEEKVLDQIISQARDAVLTILSKGTEVGMNLFNSKNFKASD